MLEKNADLKMLILDQTPWVQAAASNSARMTALAELLEPEKVDAAINASLTALKKLQNADGGFSWGSWYNESSPWCTETVLTTMGIANSLGMIRSTDTALTEMLQPAFSYVQKEIAKIKDVKTDTDLTLIDALLPDLRTTPFADGIIRNTVAEIARSWKNDDVSDKAYDILILRRHGREALCADILASIRQFGVASPGKGVSFPSVNDMRSYATIIQAYTDMKAPAAEIDALRQWVIVNAQACDNIAAYNPDYIIAALLMTGTEWTAVPVEHNVSVNGAPLQIGKVESSTGYFAQRLDTSAGRKFKITVRPNGVTPSYGSVVCIGKRTLGEVKARPGRDISIEKRILVQREGKWIQSNDFALGERVRVQLTIVSRRAMQYVSVIDSRAACFEPVDQLPGYVWDASIGFYRVNTDSETRLFISWLPAGTYTIAYDMTAGIGGEFLAGIATVQSQYAPELTAHSAAATIKVQ